MTETHEQRVERLAEVIYQHMVGLPFETVPVGEQEFGRRTARAVIASDREAGLVTVPQEPTQGLLVSMAMRYDHSFGTRHAWPKLESEDEFDARQEALMCRMRQVHEEVVGDGFYSPEKEREYQAAIAAHKQEG